MTSHTTPVQAAPTAIAPPKRQWGRALKALARLRDNKEDTAQVFEIMRSLNAASTKQGYLRLIETVEGARLAYERVELAERLMDGAYLDSFAPGTVGAAYVGFVRSEGLSAEGLAKESDKARRALPVASPYAWFGRRTRDVHDIWHILTGYGRDGLGESCVVAFSYSQTKGLGWAFIALGSALRRGGALGRARRKAIFEGWRNGARAAWLPGEDYERLLHEPLEAARARLRIGPNTSYHAALALGGDVA
jgi:ubiquinone biosynthesis protein COQ4